MNNAAKTEEEIIRAIEVREEVMLHIPEMYDVQKLAAEVHALRQELSRRI